MAENQLSGEHEELDRQEFYRAFLFEYGRLSRSEFRRELQTLAGGLDPTAVAAFDRWRRQHSRADDALQLPEGAAYRSVTRSWFTAHRSANTRRAYARDLGDWLTRSQVRGLDPLQADPLDITAYLNELHATGRPPAASSVNRKLSALSSWYSCLVENDLIASSPVDTAHRRPTDRGTAAGVHLTKDEVQRLLQAADATARDRHAALGPAHDHVVAARRDRVLIRVLAELGLTVSEACRLSVIDLQADHHGRAVVGVGSAARRRYLDVSPDLLLHLEPLIVERRRALALARLARELTYALAPESRQRLLADLDRLDRLPTPWVESSAKSWPGLDDVLSSAVESYRAYRAQRARIEAMTSAQLAEEQPAGLLFATASGQELKQAQVYGMVRRIARKAGLSADRVGPQRLRRTATAAAREAGVGPV